MTTNRKKVRVELRKNRGKPPRANDITRQFGDDGDATGDLHGGERVRAKGDLSRRRTIVTPDEHAQPAADGECQAGRVLKVQGLFSFVELDDGSTRKCSVRRILKSLSIDERSVVTTGDRVLVRAAPDGEGVIERVEPRRGVLTRASRRREHVLVANVDQVVIVLSLVEPALKVHLIDRYIAAALKGELKPILVLNKVDLADAAELQPLVGEYSQLGVPTILTSARTGVGLERLRKLLVDRATVFSGQSGVGKSSLLNAIEPGLGLRVREVSDVNSKGRHTTTTAELIRLTSGGWVVDTPGVRQLQLWDVAREEVEGFFTEFAPFIALCKFPDCTHLHEGGCAVLDAVQRHWISERRYISYVGLYRGLDET